ncbi:MAG: GNAT family N-acetyltransferase [Acidimicrobiales bacterium]
MKIVKASRDHIAEVSRLFDLYRQFYECPPDPELATKFITERIEREESDIFVAMDGDAAAGFVQLYPSFCSVQAVKIFILYDLYVEASQRRLGLGEQLMNAATDWARSRGAARLDLLTAHDNVDGQRLYEKLKWVRTGEDFRAYSLDIGSDS